MTDILHFQDQIPYHRRKFGIKPVADKEKARSVSGYDILSPLIKLL